MQRSNVMLATIDNQARDVDKAKKLAAVKQAARGKLLPALILGLYYFTTWNPPIEWLPGFTWYILFALAVFVYIIQQKPLDFEKARGYWIPQGLMFLGAVLSLLRADNLDETLFTTLGLGIGLITFFLLLPTFATVRGRAFVLFGLIAAAFVWVYYVQDQRIILVKITSSTFVDEDNKNIISLCMALAATAMLAFSVLWNRPEKLGKPAALMVRLVSAAAGLYTIYTISLTYSRSQLMSALFGLAISILLIAIKLRTKKGLLLTGLALMSIVALVYAVIPNILTIAVDWEYEIDPLLALDSPSTFASRRDLLEKGLAIIGSNPLVGIGPGNTKPAYFDGFQYHPRGLLHNTYLSIWAEEGILGLLGFLYWLGLYLGNLRKRFFQKKLIDQIWLIVLLPFMFSLFFINVHITIPVTILSGIFYTSESLTMEPLSS